MSFTRVLGKSKLEVSALGMGCWAIGGETQSEEMFGSGHFGWGQTDDAEAIRAIHAAIDHGVTLFDTSDIYGAGHSEAVLGKALQGRRDKVRLVTKFGLAFNPYTRRLTEYQASPQYMRYALQGSMQRLQTDFIDVYQFHIGGYDPDFADIVRDELDKMVERGLIGTYGWSTESLVGLTSFAKGKYFTMVQNSVNLFEDQPEVLAFAEEHDLGYIGNSPLAMGLLTGKFTPETTFPANDIRSRHMDLKHGQAAQQLQQLDALREVLTSEGRTLAQGALGWVWARSERLVPVPGIRTVKQAEENAGALDFGPLNDTQIAQISEILEKEVPA